jgi:ribosomal protein L22
MTPSNPQDPQKGKVDEAKVEEDAKETTQTTSSSGTGKQVPEEAAAQPKAKAKSKAKAKAKATQTTSSSGTGKPAPAAEETGVDKAAADVEADDAKAKPKAKAKAKAKAQPAKAKARPARRRRGYDESVEEGVVVRAQAKYVRTSARKARLVCDHIRGKDVAEARAILAFTPRAAAKAWIKLLESAVANAEHNHELVGEDLRIAAVHADEGPTLKRYRPRAMGRATRIRKRTSHLTITLTPKES